jgi:two-component system, OmpR family, response regulator
VSEHLLLVDADPALHRSLAGLLKRGGREVADAYDGREALECLRSSPFDVVLAGEGRNGLNGLALLRRVRSVCPHARVIVAGQADVNAVVGAIRCGAWGYLHKPLRPNTVGDMVQQALDADGWRGDIRVLSARPEWITLAVRSKLGAVERATCYFRELVSDLPQAKCDDVAAAFRELLLNGVEHGGKLNAHKRVRVSVLRTRRALTVHIQDPGPGFSLQALPHAAISNPEGSPTRHVEVREEQGQRPGGFGILMTRNLVDELVYNERGNAVVFVKYL